ncbi:Hypothetical predicted protein [Pelobates cultripes]|uniref:Serine/threonine-protein kinase WNK CCTL2 domain-containing protein n=1 Tax=Pelobates cultripes TaxID=61616 RepID=A0AAD1SWC2_PELCU|nr:Hypothetical predicted protein [Pelobates cultripes]
MDGTSDPNLRVQCEAESEESAKGSINIHGLKTMDTAMLNSVRDVQRGPAVKDCKTVKQRFLRRTVVDSDQEEPPVLDLTDSDCPNKVIPISRARRAIAKRTKGISDQKHGTAPLESNSKIAEEPPEQAGDSIKKQEPGISKDVSKSQKEEEEDSEEADIKAVSTSPDGRFLKFDIEIGRGSFKTVYKGLDTETWVEVAWCELQTGSNGDISIPCSNIDLTASKICIVEYSTNSGYRLNIEKTEALPIHITPEELPSLQATYPFQYNKTYIHYLGTNLPADTLQTYQLNYAPLLQKLPFLDRLMGNYNTHKAVRLYCRKPELPPYPIIPAVTPLTGFGNLPANISELPAVCITPLPANCQYFSPGAVSVPPAANPPQSAQAVHTQFALPYEANVVPNIQVASIPLLAVAQTGMPALPNPSQPLARLPQATAFPQIIQSDAASSNHSPNIQTVAQQSLLPVPQSPHPSIIHPSDQTPSLAGNQVVGLSNYTVDIGTSVAVMSGAPPTVHLNADMNFTMQGLEPYIHSKVDPVGSETQSIPLYATGMHHNVSHSDMSTYTVSQSVTDPGQEEQTMQINQLPSTQNCDNYPGSDAASGKEMSDTHEGFHSGSKQAKKHHRRSSRTRSRQEKTNKPKLTILNVSNTGDKMVECQLETHNHKMVTFKFDLDGDAPEEIATYMVENEFILQSEKEIFIEQMKDVIDKAEDMLSEDTEGERSSDQGASPQKADSFRTEMTEETHHSQAKTPVYQQNEERVTEDVKQICPTEANTLDLSLGHPFLVDPGEPATGIPASITQSSSTISSSDLQTQTEFSLSTLPESSSFLQGESITPSVSTVLQSVKESSPLGPIIHASSQKGNYDSPTTSLSVTSALELEQEISGQHTISAVKSLSENVPLSTALPAGDQFANIPRETVLELQSEQSLLYESDIGSPVVNQVKSAVCLDSSLNALDGPLHPFQDTTTICLTTLQMQSQALTLPVTSSSTQAGNLTESDGEGPPRVEFADDTIKSLDEKLRTLLYQEYPPTNLSAATPENSCGLESAAEGIFLQRINEEMSLECRHLDQSISQSADLASSVTDTSMSNLPNKRVQNKLPMLSQKGAPGEKTPLDESSVDCVSQKQKAACSDKPSKTIGRFSVMSTEDNVTVTSPNYLRFSAPPDVYLDQLPPQPVKTVPRSHTSSPINSLFCGHVSSDSDDDVPMSKSKDAQPSTPSKGGTNDFIKKATAFLHRSGKTSVQSPDSPSGHTTKIPSINITSFHSQSSYMSSDNDSEFEDADMRKELQRLREKHMKEITELQVQQKREIEALYVRLGKPLPPNVGFLHAAPPSGRRRRISKNKLKTGKLVNPLVQQLKNATSVTNNIAVDCNGSPGKNIVKSHADSKSQDAGTSFTASTVRAVQTQQPCSVKVTVSSDNICTGVVRESTDIHGVSGQGWTVYHQTSERVTYKSSSKPRTRFLSGPVSLSIWSTLKRLCLGKDHSIRSSTSSLATGAECSSVPPMTAPQIQAQTNNSNNKKGTFTDDLHKLVDEWASKTVGAAQFKPSLNQLKQYQQWQDLERKPGTLDMGGVNPILPDSGRKCHLMTSTTSKGPVSPSSHPAALSRVTETGTGPLCQYAGIFPTSTMYSTQWAKVAQPGIVGSQMVAPVPSNNVQLFPSTLQPPSRNSSSSNLRIT